MAADRLMMHLDNQRYVVWNNVDGKDTIRLEDTAFNDNPNNSRKKRIHLNTAQWVDLRMYAEQITTVTRVEGSEQEDERRWHLGGNVYATIKKGWPFVDFRKFWIPEDCIRKDCMLPGDFQVRPSKHGISLTYEEWYRLTELMEPFESTIPGLKEQQSCLMDHANQMGMLRCSHCNPNGCSTW